MAVRLSGDSSDDTGFPPDPLRTPAVRCCQLFRDCSTTAEFCHPMDQPAHPSGCVQFSLAAVGLVGVGRGYSCGQLRAHEFTAPAWPVGTSQLGIVPPVVCLWKRCLSGVGGVSVDDGQPDIHHYAKPWSWV